MPEPVRQAKVELFSDQGFGYDWGVPTVVQMAVSDDGKYVAVSDRWSVPVMYRIEESCTMPISPDYH